jgi:hypothetical protein
VNVWKRIESTGTLWNLTEGGRIVQCIDEEARENDESGSPVTVTSRLS